MTQMKKYLVVFVATIVMLAVSFVNVVNVAFAEAANTITLAVVGDDERKVILCPKEVDVDGDETVLQILQEEFPNGITTESSSWGEYLTGIDGLVTGGDNPNSYWYFELNGGYASLGVDAYKPQAGEVIALRYVQDWNVGLGDTTLEESIATYGGCEEQAEEPTETTDPAEPVENEDDQTTDDATGSDQEEITPDDTTSSDSEQQEDSDIVSTENVDAAIASTVGYIMNKGFESDWEIIGVLQSGAAVSDEVKATYVSSLEERVKTSARLNNTTLARTILAITALGENPTHFAGQNLIAKLSNDTTVNSINGYAYALLALDSKNYEIPSDAKWTRDALLAQILDLQNTDGGWSFSSETSDPDMTGMVLTALAPYKSSEEVQGAIYDAVQLLENLQTENGGYASGDQENANSAAQVLTGLAAIGIDPVADSFTELQALSVTNKQTLIDNLLSFQQQDGSFKWLLADTEASSLATEQALYALVQYKFYLEEKGSVFHWTETAAPVDNTDDESTDEPAVEEEKSDTTTGNPSTETEAPTSSDTDDTTTVETVTVTDTESATTTNTATTSPTASTSGTLPDTAMFGTGTAVATAAGVVLMASGLVMWRRKRAA